MLASNATQQRSIDDGLGLRKFFGLSFGNIFEAGALGDPEFMVACPSRSSRKHLRSPPMASENPAVCYRPRRSRVHLGNVGLGAPECPEQYFGVMRIRKRSPLAGNRHISAHLQAPSLSSRTRSEGGRPCRSSLSLMTTATFSLRCRSHSKRRAIAS